jgi:urea carboxylase
MNLANRTAQTEAENWAGLPSAIVYRREAGVGKPSGTYRVAGDTYLLVEFGNMELDLNLNFFVHSLDSHINGIGLTGLNETSPGFRSILISYNPSETHLDELVSAIDAAYDSVASTHQLSLPSRLIHLPAAFDDSTSKAAVARYTQTIRSDAPNCADDNNIDYTLTYNGLNDLDELVDHVTGTDLWVGFIGFFPGLPFMFPLDPRQVLFAPKYNPTRTWTAEGAIGLGGPCYSIYPVESPGGYQLLGRTLPVYDVEQRNAAFSESPLLLRPRDRVRFHQVSETELLETYEAVHNNEYVYEIEEGTFDVAFYNSWCSSVAGEASAFAVKRDAAAAATPIP